MVARVQDDEAARGRCTHGAARVDDDDGARRFRAAIDRHLSTPLPAKYSFGIAFRFLLSTFWSSKVAQCGLVKYYCNSGCRVVAALPPINPRRTQRPVVGSNGSLGDSDRAEGGRIRRFGWPW